MVVEAPRVVVVEVVDTVDPVDRAAAGTAQGSHLDNHRKGVASSMVVVEVA